MRVEGYVRRSAAHEPDAVAVSDPRRRLRWREVGPEVEAQARRLAGLGVGRGVRVAVLSRNRVELFTLTFAVARLGGVLVPLSWRLRTNELGAILADARPAVVIAERSLTVALEALRERLPARWLGWDEDGAAAGWDRFEDLPLGDLPEAPADPGDVLVQMYTSGSTGAPKGVLLTHGNVAWITMAWLVESGLGPSDHFLQVTPLFHVGGMLIAMCCAASGAHLQLLPEFAPGPVARALAGDGVTQTLLVPAMLHWLLSDPASDGLVCPSLRLVMYGASPISPPLLRRAMEKLGGRFLQGYGLTETGGVLTGLRPEDHHDERLLSSAGRGVQGVEIEVRGPDGRALPPRAVGEVVARGPNVTVGYWGREADTAETLRGGWLHTGDLGWLDERGFLFLVDRVKDLVVVGGENVYPRQVEEVLLEHPGVADAAVIGVPHEVWGEQVLAIVVPRGEPDPDLDRAVVRWCRDHLARFKCPTRVEVRSEIPRNAAGKIMKALLREPHWAGRERRVV